MWKRSHGRTTKAPPDERGGNRYVRPTATAPHLDLYEDAAVKGVFWWCLAILITPGYGFRRAVKPRSYGASFTAVEQLQEHIDAFIAAYNETAEPFVWTKKKVHQRRFENRRITQL
jgi:hypothetical protein